MDAEPSQPTQPATQQVLDPRRLGRNNSGLRDVDIADVLIILHPASKTAIRIVEDAAQHRPEHVLFRNLYDSLSGSLADIEEQETIIVNGAGERMGRPSRAGADLALRMSSARRLKHKQLGFIFGRNHQSADIIFGQDSGKRISNQHFRIYLTQDGVTMLEDMSTNGTIVDDVLLKCKDKRFQKIHMLTSGSIICIQNANDAEMIKFIVRIPSRTDYMDLFSENLRHFITECSPDFGPDQDKALKRITQQLKGPTMKWNGGDRYNILGQVGKGAFATVYQLATKMDGKLFAAKELEKRRFMKNGMLDKKIDNEMKIMQALRHPNIVEFVEYYDQGDYLYIIMEYVRQGDLLGYLNKALMKEAMAKTMAQQILHALNYLHNQNITHRDIKPDNILIADFEPFTVKLSDFGLSKVVKHDETFLKTFCGTLLYCAPEVFPFSGEPSKGTKRRRGGKTYHAYSSSVDIWSFGGVLWYALCGEPPFKGIADATGEAMFNNIMATTLNPAPLVKAGVSATCIDLLMRMLQIDPADRPTDRECLMHPWLRDEAHVPKDPALQSIVEEDESEDTEQQLSQLSLQGDAQREEEEDDGYGVVDDEELMGFLESRQSKRIRTDPLYPRNQHRDQGDSSADPSFQSSHVINEGESFRIMPTPRQPRLFGEIGLSALGSSAVLNERANSALIQEDATPAAHYLQPVAESHTLGGAEQHGSQRPTSQLEHAFSSPSLLGAESLVRDLNMAEAHSPASRAQSPVLPATPKTPDVFQHNSLDNSSKQHSQVSEPTPRPQTTGINRQINLPLTASYYYDPMDPSTHNLEYASRVSGLNFMANGEVAPDTSSGAASHGAAPVEPKHTLQSDVIHDSVNTQVTREGEIRHDTSDYSASSFASSDVPSAAMPSVPAELDFKPPPRPLGKMIATPDSFSPNLILNLNQSKMSWGRMPSNTIVYENKRDTRVPKTAFIVFWYSSASQDRDSVEVLSQQGKDWTGLDDLHAGIWTCARYGLSINGKHLQRSDEKGRALYTHLHTGDIVQVYANANGTELMRFRCELYLGSGQTPRPAGESFTTLVGHMLSRE